MNPSVSLPGGVSTVAGEKDVRLRSDRTSNPTQLDRYQKTKDPDNKLP